MFDAFNVLRKCLCNFCVLTVPSVSDVFKYHTDASGQGLRSVLNVVRGDEVLPVAFQSRQLKGAEHNYSATELDAFNMLEATKHVTYILYDLDGILMQ